MERPVKQKHDRPFNVLLTLDEVAKLDHLSAHTGETRGQVIRKLIAAAFAMRCEGRPFCASIRPCLVPQLHTRNDKAPAEDVI